MRWYPSMVAAMTQQLTGHEFVRLQPGYSGTVHVWSSSNQLNTVCGHLLTSRHRLARNGGGSLCGPCEAHLEQHNFVFPARDEKPEG